MKHSLSQFEFLQTLYEAWISERPSQMAAALAYFGLFSIAPILFLAFTLANLFLKQVEYGQFLDRVEFTLGLDTAIWIEDSVRALNEKTFGGSTLVTIISFLALLFAASGMFFQIQFALNSIFKVSDIDRDKTKTFILQRLFSFLMVIGVGLLLILMSILNVAITWFGSLLGDITGVGQALALINWLMLFGIIMFSLALIYKILPDRKFTWRDVWPGSALAAVLVLLAGMLLGFYFRIGKIGSAFEAAGTIAIILIAFNIFSQIFLFGALFIREYALNYGSGKKLVERPVG